MMILTALHLLGVPATCGCVTETYVDIAADWFIGIGCGLIVLFTLIYGVLFKWWQTRAGRGIFFTMTAMSLALIRATVAQEYPHDYFGRDWLRLIVFATLPIAVSYMFYALFRNFVDGPTQNIEIESRASKPEDHPKTDTINVIQDNPQDNP
jgi:hypothetical protein